MKKLLLTAFSAIIGGTMPMIPQGIFNNIIEQQINTNKTEIIDFNVLNQKVALDVLKQTFPDKAIKGVTNVNVTNLDVADIKGKVTGTTSTEASQAIFMGQDVLDLTMVALGLLFSIKSVQLTLYVSKLNIKYVRIICYIG